MKLDPLPDPASGDPSLDRQLLALAADFQASAAPYRDFPSLQMSFGKPEAPAAVKAFRSLVSAPSAARSTAIARWFLAVARTHRDRDDGRGLRDPDWKSLPHEEAQAEFRARFNRWALLGSLADVLALSRSAADEKLLLDGLASVSSEEAKAIVVRAVQGGALHNRSLFDQAPTIQPPSTEAVEQMCRDFARHGAALYRGPLDVMGDQRAHPGFVGWHRDDSPVCWGPMRQLAELVLNAGPERSHAVLSPLLAPPEPAVGILSALMNRPDIAETRVWLATLVPLAAGAFEAEKRQRWSVMRLALNTFDDSPAAWVGVVTMATEGWPRDEALQKLARIGGDPENRTAVLAAIREALGGALASQPRGLAALRLRRLERTVSAADTPPGVKLKYTVKGSVGTDGGPVIAIPKEALAAWEGAEPPSKGRSVTDYDRACDIPKVGLLQVGDHTAIVLGHQSCDWIPMKGSGLLVLEGSIEEVHEHLLGDGHDVAWQALGKLEFPSGTLVVIDATQHGKKPRSPIKIKLPPGAYQVSWTEIDDDRGWIWAAKIDGASTAVKPAKGKRKPAR